jgi:hypothetical protein
LAAALVEVVEIRNLQAVQSGANCLVRNGLLMTGGVTSRNPIATYTPHAAEQPLTLQGHVGPAWYRNVWVRRLKGYDT